MKELILYFTVQSKYSNNFIFYFRDPKDRSDWVKANTTQVGSSFLYNGEPISVGKEKRWIYA